MSERSKGEPKPLPAIIEVVPGRAANCAVAKTSSRVSKRVEFAKLWFRVWGMEKIAIFGGK
jgi:hypothetical protein